MTDIRRKRKRPQSKVILAVAHIIRSGAFNTSCIPDRNTGREPYRIGWGRSVGRLDPALVATPANEQVWLLSRLEALYFKNIDRSLPYPEQVEALITKFKALH